MRTFEDLVDDAFNTLPDGQEDFANQIFYDDLKEDMQIYNDSQDPSDRTYLLAKYIDFIDKTQTKKISAEITALPANGPAPLAVTLRADNVRDESLNNVPDDNFIWWMKDGR